MLIWIHALFKCRLLFQGSMKLYVAVDKSVLRISSSKCIEVQVVELEMEGEYSPYIGGYGNDLNDSFIPSP